MSQQPYATLRNGIKMPLLGLGMWDMYGQEAVQAVQWALETGYRLLDTAAMYQNEQETGDGMRNSGVPREEIFVTTKVNNTDQGYDKTLLGFEESLRKLDCGYIDLYLIHWPIKTTRSATWKALEQLYQDGRVRAIGVANYLIPFLEELLPQAAVVPAVNQVEFSPWLYLEDLLNYCRERQILLQAYTPLVRGKKMDDPHLLALSRKYGKTPAQIILRWVLQHGVSAIPKSSNLLRLRANFDVFDFEISESDMLAINNFNENLRVVDDPMSLF